MAEYIKRKILADLVLAKLKYMGDARIMNQNDEKVLSKIDGYEKAICDVHELILDEDLIEDAQPVNHGRWELTDNPSFRKCSECGAWWSSDITDNCFTKYCPKCGARMIKDSDTNERS